MVDGWISPVIKLIRASDSDQEDFGVTATGAFDTDAYNAWVSGTTAKVVTWYDQSGNGYDAAQSTDANRPEFKINIQSLPVVFFRDADFTPQLTLTLPSGISNKLNDMTQITVARCVDEFQSAILGPVWPSFGVGAGFNDFGGSGGVIEITSPTDSTGFYDRALNGLPTTSLNLLPNMSRMEAIGFYNSGIGSDSADQRYMISSLRAPTTTTGSIPVWKNAGVAQMPIGGSLGARGDGGNQSQAEVQCMMLARGGSVLQTEEIMEVMQTSYALRTGAERVVWWCGDSLSAGYEGGYDFRSRSPGVLCDALQDRFLVMTYAKAGKRFDQLDADCANATTGIDHWMTAAQTKMDYAAIVIGSLGTNDLNATANGGSAASLATLQSRCNAFVAARKATNARLVLITTIAAAGSYITNDTTRTDYNSWLMAGSSDADGVIDIASLDFTGKMQGDGVHWTEEGNAMVAQAVADYLASVLPEPP
jgi:lysophospholipase L1-like esterase